MIISSLHTHGVRIGLSELHYVHQHSEISYYSQSGSEFRITIVHHIPSHKEVSGHAPPLHWKITSTS
jgi:hypothetical protein